MLLQIVIIFIGDGLSTLSVNANAESTLIATVTSYEIWNAIIPTFLEKANAAARKQLQQIIKNESLRIADVDNMIEKWATQQEPEVQALYHQSMMQFDHIRSEMLKAINESTLSDAAKTTLYKIFDVVNDKRETMKEQKLKITAIRENSPKNVSDEIGKYLMKHLFHTLSTLEESSLD